jgi:hypothetical protein
MAEGFKLSCAPVLPRLSPRDYGVYWRLRKLEPNITLTIWKKKEMVRYLFGQSIEPDFVENLERS